MKTKEEFVKCSKCNGSGEEWWHSHDGRLFPKVAPCNRCGGSGWISTNSIFKTIKGWIEGMKKNTFKIITNEIFIPYVTMVVSVIFLIAMSINIVIKLHEIHESVIQIKSSISDIQRDSGEIAGMIRDVQGTGTVK